jgi:hypothetical protein
LKGGTWYYGHRLRKETAMDNVTVIRVIAGMCFFIVIAFLILRRRKKLN